MNLKCVVGLGNPGKEYQMTRHNVGFMVVQKLADSLGAHLRYDARFEGWRAKAAIDEQSVQLLLPATYMNESGRAVHKLLDYFQVTPSDTLVVVDDMDLAFGQMRLKALGGAGGHNGLKSVIRSLGTQGFPRLRIGIGKAPSSHIEHVLDDFSPEEQTQLEEILDKAVDGVKRLAHVALSKVAESVNRREKITNKDAL